MPPNPQLKSYNSDRQDAVLAWGDNNAGDPNPAGGSVGPDYLRFINLHIYSNGSSAPSASEENGLEVMRMSPNTNIGIGNFYNDPNYATKDPLRRLEILANRATSAGEAQLRLTYAQQGSSTTNTNAGIFTDIWNTNLGDLAILPTDNTQTNTSSRTAKQRHVGINTSAPANTLEINSQLSSSTLQDNGVPGSVAGTTGASGLRFTDLKVGSTPLTTNPHSVPAVLTVDANGDVILVKDQTGPGGGGSTLGNPCGLTPDNHLTGSWEIPLHGNNFIFSSNNFTGNVGIGGYNCTPTDKLTILGNSLESNTGVHVTNITNAATSTAFYQLTNDIPGNSVVMKMHSSTYSSPSNFEITTPKGLDISPEFNSDINLKTASGVVNINSVTAGVIPAGTSLAVHATEGYRECRRCSLEY